MTRDIETKIKDVICQKTYSERDVVYFFVESYKFLERKYDKQFGDGKYNQIKFYRDWVCHSYLHGASYKVFKDVDALIKAEANKPNALGHLDWLDAMTNKIRDCFRDYGLLRLKEDIINFFPEIGYDGKFDWENFRASLYEVIRDIQLIIKDGDEIIFSFKCITPVIRVSNDDLDLEVIIKRSDKINFVLDDRSLEDGA